MKDSRRAIAVANLPDYAETKDSGVGWLGDVPTHWEVRRLGQIGAFAKGRGGSKDDEVAVGVPCVRYGDLYTTHQNFIHDARSAVPERVASEYTPIGFGDILFATSGETLDEIGKSAVNLIPSEARCGGDILIFRCKHRVDPRYMGYATGTWGAAAQKACMGRGITVMHIYGDQLKRLAVTLPPLVEQNAIVRFLDHLDGRIRRAIREKERLLELLDEQRLAVIEKAVTGQVDVRTGSPFSAYKDSGVDWLPRVPAHWTMRRNKSLFTERNETGHGDLPVLEVSLRSGVGIRDMEDGARKQQMTDRDKYKRTARGDITYNMMRLWQGATGVVPADGLVSPAYVVARPLRGVEVSYYAYLFRTGAYKQEVDRNSRGIVSDRNRLYWDAFKRLASPCPPSEEQWRIVEHLDAAVDRLDAGAESARHQVALLREYRDRLVADVVTGKLDVRAAAEALPEVEP